MDPRTTRPWRKQYVEVVACQPKENFDPLLDKDAIRYRVRIHGKDTFLYRSRERWFVEMKDG